MGIGIKNLIGQRFDKLVVIKLADQSWRGAAFWLCKCDCGEKKIISGNHLQTGNTKSCGCLHRESASTLCKERNVKGKNSPGYIDGRKKAALELKESIRKRDNYICQDCGVSQKEHEKKYNRILDVHHIDGDDTNNDPKNMITLCRSCHNNTRKIR